MSALSLLEVKKSVLEELLQREMQQLGVPWVKPLTNYIEHDEEFCLEWWKGDRKITIYVDATRYMILRVWGPDMEDEMSDVSVNDADDPAFREAFQWLYEKQ